MSQIVLDGTGKGYRAKVNSDNHLEVNSVSEALQHFHSFSKGRVYQLIGDFASINNSTFNILHVKNNDSTRNMVFTYIRLQAIVAGVTIPAVTDYFQIGTGLTYSSGGTAVTPVNVNFTSGNVAAVTAYDNNPTLTGTFTEIDRWYLKATGEMMTFNKEGSVVVGLNDTLTIRYVGASTSGTAYVRVTFFMESNDV